MIRRIGLTLLLLLGVLLVCHVYLLRGIANWLDVTDPKFPTDYVVVLPGGPETRTFAGVVILREGLADKVAILRNPNTSAVDEGLHLPTHVLTQRIMQKRGISDDRIVFLDGESTTTHTDLQLMAAIWEQQPDATVTIVTNRFHTRRAQWAATSVFGDRADRISFVGAESDGFQWDRWWKSRQGLEFIAAEYLKLTYYLIVYSTATQRFFYVSIFIVPAILVGLLVRRHRRSCLDTDPTLV